jgi:hypothetical protein
MLSNSSRFCNEWNVVSGEESVDEISCRRVRVMIEEVEVEVTKDVASFILYFWVL